jgi:hypothetical protein
MDLGDTNNTFVSMKTDKLKEGQKVQISVENSIGDEGWSGDVRTLFYLASASWHDVER